MVTWSPGAGGLASGRVAAGASEHLMEHLPEVPLLPVPRLPRSFSALLSLISALHIYFPPCLPQAVGIFVVLETSSPEKQEVFGSEEFRAATDSREPAPGWGWGPVSFQARGEQVPWMGLNSRIPASISQQRRPHG